LLQQLGAVEGLVSLGSASGTLRLPRVKCRATLSLFLETYQSQILIPFELPAIQRAFLHASRNETRELIAVDRQIAREPLLRAFASASRRVGRGQLKRLRPLRDHRLLQRYLKAVEQGQAHGWHTLVYGITLSVYSMPLIQGLLNYERQTLIGFLHAAACSLRLSEKDCRHIAEELCADLHLDLTSSLPDESESGAAAR
jgi:urease accessory protein UreF